MEQAGVELFHAQGIRYSRFKDTLLDTGKIQVGLSRATLESQVKVFLLVLLKSKYTDATVQLDHEHNFLERIVPCPELTRPELTCADLT